MKSLIRFWKKDIINKLIALVFLALTVGTLALIALIFNMPQGRSFSEAFADFIPVRATPTVDYKAYLAQKTPAGQTPTSAPALIPTFTPMPPAATLELPPIPQALPSATPEPAETVSAADTSCVPGNPAQTGTVIEVLDGNTMRVYIEKLVYVVRYIGVAAPTDKIFADMARQKNSELTFGAEVTLIPDAVDKDDRGRLLRYVLIGDLLVNQEIINLGLGSALDSPPNLPCAQRFSRAEESARASMLGMWKVIPTPTP